MKVNEIVKISNCISKIKNKKLPIKMSLILIRNSKKLEEVVKDIENKRFEIISQYADKDQNGRVLNEDGQFKVSNNLTDFENDLKELFNTQIKIQLDTLSMEDIQKCDNEKYDSLTMEEVDALQYILNEPMEN